MRLYVEVPLVLVMSVLAFFPIYLVLRASNAPEAEVRGILTLAAILTTIGIGIGYYIRFRRWRSGADNEGLNQIRGVRFVIRVSIISAVILFASLWGLYLVVSQRYWYLGAGLVLACGLSSLLLLKRLVSVNATRDRSK